MSEATNEEKAERIEIRRFIPEDAARIFSVVRDPEGHVTIDSTGMLQSWTGEPAAKVGDEFVIHMDRESLNDYPMGKYDVTVTITRDEQDRAIVWTILGQIKPQIGHVYGYRARAGRRRHDGDVVLRLVRHRTGVEAGRHLSGHLGDGGASDARDPGADVGAIDDLVGLLGRWVSVLVDRRRSRGCGHGLRPFHDRGLLPLGQTVLELVLG